MHSEIFKEELKLLSKEHDVTIEQLREIVYLTFKFIREIVKSACRETLYFPAIRLMGIGIFHVTNAKQNKLREKYDKGNSKESEE